MTSWREGFGNIWETSLSLEGDLERMRIITSSSDTFVFKMPQKTRPNNQTYPESM